MHKKSEIVSVTMPPHRWTGGRVLETAHRLNEKCVTLLAQTVQAHAACISDSAILGAQDLWARVDARACERAGRCPVLLMDLNFRRPDWWNRVGRGGENGLAHVVPRMLFSQERAAPLLREILIEAWSFARSMPHAAGLIFGIVPPVSAVIANLTVTDVEQVVVNHLSQLRPRWEHNRMFWSRLLEAAAGTDEIALIDVHRYSLQLLGGDLAPRHNQH